MAKPYHKRRSHGRGSSGVGISRHLYSILLPLQKLRRILYPAPTPGEPHTESLRAEFAPNCCFPFVNPPIFRPAPFLMTSRATGSSGRAGLQDVNISQHRGAAPGLTPVSLIHQPAVPGCPVSRREKGAGRVQLCQLQLSELPQKPIKCQALL